MSAQCPKTAAPGAGTELALSLSAALPGESRFHMTRRLLAFLLVVAGLAVLLPAEALAQRRGPTRRPVVVVSPQRTIVYPPWYGPWGYPIGYGQYPYPYPYPSRYGYYRDDADLRIQTTPRETEVYVDGARAGIVDDYDGIFQRLHLRPGEHEITLYLAGYRSWSETRYFGPHSDQRILHTMLPLAPGQPDDPRPVKTVRPIQIDDQNRPYDPRDPREPRREPTRTVTPIAVEPPPADKPATDPRSFGTLSVSVTPSDAEITLDGQKQSLTSGNRFVIQLSEGVHHLVIRKNSFDTFETDLQIRRGRTLSFEVNLVK
jgi:hypothetical protein